MGFKYSIQILSLCLVLHVFAKRSKEEDELSDAKNELGVEKRKGKFLPIFQVVQFNNDPCIGSGNRNGTCFTAQECTSRMGTAAGSCASSYGVCCTFTKECGSTINEQTSYLVQEAGTALAANPCTYMICRCSTDICRIRLDFMAFEIRGPQVGTTSLVDPAVAVGEGGAIGDCLQDSFTLTSPGGTGSPTICGVNNGQHMIVEASAACNSASFNIGNMAGNTNNWDIKVTQFRCGDDEAGPPGCLQYFTESTGTIRSFNFPTTAAIGPQVTHLSSQCYSMCVRQNPGICGICYEVSIAGAGTTAMQGSFGLSKSPAAAAQSGVGIACSEDYLEIPGAMDGFPAALTPLETRRCGRFFNSGNGQTVSNMICTRSTPFRITFKTDANERDVAGDATANEETKAPGGIVGFSLKYTQKMTC